MALYEDKIRELGIPFGNPENLPAGCLNYLFRGVYKETPAILKIYNRNFEDSEERLGNELQVLKKPGKIKVPALLGYSIEDMWIVMAIARGITLKEAIERGAQVNTLSITSAMREIHSQQRASEANSLSYLGKCVSGLEKKLIEAKKGIEPLLSKAIERGIDYLKREMLYLDSMEMCRVHGDFNGHNVLVDTCGNVEVILDWEFSHTGNPYRDIAQFTNRNDRFAQEVLRHYFNGSIDKKAYDFFLVHFLIKLVLNNTPQSKMAFLRKEKTEIVRSKSERLKEMFL